MADTCRPLVVALRGHGRAPAVRDVDDHALGGKAAALDRLIDLGYAVPRSAVLTTEAYRRAVADGPLHDHLAALRAEPIPEPVDHDTARAAVDQAFLDAPLPTSVVDAIGRLSTLVASDDDPCVAIALRSSATAEDLGTASFAGQYRSFLNVPPDGVERAVRLTWASLWHPAPRTYRMFRGLGDEVEMAVLAMAMIDAVVAGVLFTRDPAGSAGDVRLESVAGLGEALVSGARTPESHVLPRGEAAARAGQLDAALGDLVRQGLALEATLRRPQDVEWAIDHDHRLWFLQARPITSLLDVDDEHALDDGFDVHPDGAPALTTAGIGEMLPGVLPPLLWDATSWQVEDGFRRLFDSLGGHLDGLDATHALVARVRGRAALDLDRMRAVAASLPGGSADELERRYFGEVLSTEEGASEVRHAGAWQGMRLLLDRHQAAVESQIVIDAVDRLLDEEPDPATFDDTGLLAYRTRVHDLAARTAAAEITTAALAAAAYRGVETFLADHLGPDAATTVAQRVTRKPGAARRGVTALRFEALGPGAAAVCDRARAAELDWDAARSRLSTMPDGRRFLDRWWAMLGRAGSTAVFGGPTWADAPDLAWLSFRSQLADRPSSGAARRDHALGTATTSDDVLATLRAGPSHAHISVARRRFLRREIDDATELLDRRERTKAALLMLGGIARRIDDEIGRRLAARHMLEDADDVRLLAGRELSALAGGGHPTLEVVARRRRRLHAATVAGPLPRLFRGTPTAEIHLAIDGAPGGERGWAASPGWYEGPARIVTTPASGAIRRGEVLVARTTDASWAPLFLLAGAIVVEEGGPLSHAAIVARELGAPAVVNVPGIVDRVAAAGEGVHLTVDGSNGTVRLHPRDPVDESPFVPVRSAPAPVDLNRIGVFVTGLIGAGAALSALVTITETIGSARGGRRTLRRAGGAAISAADLVVHGTTHVAATRVGLRSARWYATAAAVALAGAVAMLGGGTAHVARNADSHELAIVWFAAALLSGIPLLGAALLLARASVAWPDVPAPIRRHLGGTTPAGGGSLFWRAMPRLHRRVIAVLAGIVAALLTLAVTAESVLLSIDEPLYDLIDANQYAGLWGPHWFGMYFGRPQVVIPVALLVALFTLRCRVLALAYPLSIVFGGIVNMGVGYLVGRQRPPLSNHADQTDSFPSGHAIEVTLLLGLAPLAIAVLLRSRWAGRVARVAATAVLAVMLADGVRDGSHWLSDHVAGFCIALAAVVFVHALARMPTLHEQCHSCPALAITRRREAPNQEAASP